MAKKTTAIQLHPKLQKFRKAMDSRTSIKDVFVEPSFRIDSINTGSTVMNMLIGGSRLPDGSFVCPGWPRGMISEVYGRESSGKSTIALIGMGHAIAGGGVGFYVDLECAVKDHYAMKLGVDFRSPAAGGTGQALRAQPHTAEETEALVTQAALNGVDFIVIDSVAGLVSEREWKRDVSNKEEKQGVAEVPRFMANWLPKLQGIIARTKTHVMFLNQTRDKIGSKAFTEEGKKSTTGGNALKFWAAVRMLLKPRRSTKAKIYNPIIKAREDVQIATDIEVKAVKNKVDAKQGHSGLITIRYGVGIDELLTMLNVAEAYNIVTKKSSSYTFTGPVSGKVVKGTGFEKFRLKLSRDPEAVKELFEACTDKIVQGYRTIDEETLAALAEGAVTKKMDDQDYELGEPPEVDYADVEIEDADEDAPVAGVIDLEVVQ